MSLSEQQILDCTKYNKRYPKEDGCSGGFVYQALQYVADQGGIDTEASYAYTEYPYCKGTNCTCKFDKSHVGAIIKGFVNVTSGSEDKLDLALASVGPISAAVYASGFQFYEGGRDFNSFFKILKYLPAILILPGVYSQPGCITDPLYLNHAILVVGYGPADKNYPPYYLIKNSWGPGWGENGYIRLARTGHNMCGVASVPVYPLV